MPEHDDAIDEPQPGAEQTAGDAIRSSRTSIVVVSIVAALTLAAATAAVVVRAVRDDRSLDELVPAATVAFVSIATEPSDEQRRALRDLFERSPGGAERAADSARAILDDAFGELGLSYRRDVEPWVGDEVAVAVMLRERRPQPVTLLAVDDEGQARETLRRAAQRERRLAFEIEDEVAYLSDDRAAIASLRKAVEDGSSLADHRPYEDARDRVGDEGLAFAWVDGEAFQRAVRATGARAAPRSFLPFGGTGAYALRAERDGLVLIGRQRQPEEAGARGAPQLLASAPQQTLAAITIFDVASLLQRAAAVFQNAVPADLQADFPDPREQLRALLRGSFGLDLERDVLPWLGGEVSILVGGFTIGAGPDVGVLIEPTDRRALARTLEALRARLPAALGALGAEVTTRRDGFTVRWGQPYGIVVRVGSDRLVLASNESYAGRLLERRRDGLARDVLYRRVLRDESEEVAFQAFVRLGRIRQLLEALGGGTVSRDSERGLALLRPFDALGVQATVDGEEGVLRMVLSVGEE